jgi:hypothetical protein
MYILYGAFIAYGLCFGLVNKLPFLYSKAFMESGEKTSFFDRLLSCSYCMGFHCGWLTWFGFWAASGTPALTWASGVQVLGAALGSAAWCYAADTAIQRLESD